MVKKLLVVGLILLLVCMSIPSTGKLMEQISTASSDGNTFYVGGDGPGNYTKIQYAIDNASEGDTVFVYNGLYYESIILNKSLNLIGEHRNKTVINGSGHFVTVRIDANNIDICGFTIQTFGLPWHWRRGINVYSNSNFINIYNNIISKNYFGIELSDIDGMVDVQIYDNYFNENKYGIEGDGNLDSIVKIYNNIIMNNEVGLAVYTNYSVYNNIVADNSIGISVRIGLTSAIYNNQIKNNKVGLKILHCSGTHIYENNFINNDIQAYVLKYAYIFFGEEFFPALKFLHSLKQKWSNNYWDDWNREFPRPIMGLSAIFFVIWIVFIRPVPIPIPIPRPYIEFDWHPAQEPYDIEV